MSWFKRRKHIHFMFGCYKRFGCCCWCCCLSLCESVSVFVQGSLCSCVPVSLCVNTPPPPPTYGQCCHIWEHFQHICSRAIYANTCLGAEIVDCEIRRHRQSVHDPQVCPQADIRPDFPYVGGVFVCVCPCVPVSLCSRVHEPLLGPSPTNGKSCPTWADFPHMLSHAI